MIRVPVGINVLTSMILFCIILLSQLTYCQDYLHYDFKNCTMNLDSNLVIEKGSWYKSPDSCSQGNNSITSGSIECPNFANISIKNVPVGQASFTWKKSGANTRFEFYIDNELSATCKSYKWVSNPVFIPEGNHTIKWVVRFDKAENGICIAGSEGEGWLCDVLVPKPLQPNSTNLPPWNFFTNGSVLPANGSVLCPFSFSIESSAAIGSTVELQATNLSSEDWKSMGFISITGPKRIIFDNIWFDSDGKKKFRFLYKGIPSEEYYGPEVFPLDLHADPSEGSNLNHYVFNISRFNIKCCNPFTIFLEIKDQCGNWKNVGKGHWDQKNITFNISNLNFSDPFLGNIKYKFEIGNNEKYIGPFDGPLVYINYKDFKYDPQMGISCEVRSKRCNEPICPYKKKEYKHIYNQCDDWEKIKWNVPLIDPKNIIIGNCDE